MGCPIGKVNSWPMWRAVNVSVEFMEVEEVDGNTLPSEQISTLSFKALWWALKARKIVWVL